jgi:hypothetical protein
VSPFVRHAWNVQSTNEKRRDLCRIVQLFDILLDNAQMAFHEDQFNVRPGTIFVNCLISDVQFDVTVIPKRPIRGKKAVFPASRRIAVSVMATFNGSELAEPGSFAVTTWCPGRLRATVKRDFERGREQTYFTYHHRI